MNFDNFNQLVEENTNKSINILKETYLEKEVLKFKSFIKTINKYYTGLEVLFRKLDKNSNQNKLLNNILMDLCSLIHCVILSDKKLIYFIYRNIIESILRYISNDINSKNLDNLFNQLVKSEEGFEKELINKYKGQLKEIYTESCRYVHTDITKIDTLLTTLTQYKSNSSNNNLKNEEKILKQLSCAIIALLKIKYRDNYELLRSNSKGYLDDILPLDIRIEYKKFLLKKYQ